jgi:hypothetical protein
MPSRKLRDRGIDTLRYTHARTRLSAPANGRTNDVVNGRLPSRPFVRGFRVLTPEEEMSDPSGMDPRIGRYQNPNAPN